MSRGFREYNRSMDINIDNIRQLPIAQQLALVEQIWDGIHDSADLVQKWHKTEARRRSPDLDDNPSIALTRDQVWK